MNTINTFFRKKLAVKKKLKPLNIKRDKKIYKKIFFVTKYVKKFNISYLFTQILIKKNIYNHKLIDFFDFRFKFNFE